MVQETRRKKERFMASQAFPFEGVVIRRDADGYGFVEFVKPIALRSQTGVFSREVLVDPHVNSSTKADVRVKGTARPFRAGFRVLRIEPA
jgi:hypothetical protein